MSTNSHSAKPDAPLSLQPSRCQPASTPRVAHGRRPAACAPAQSGAVLILGLVVLLVITLLGVTGMNTTVMQERMAGNLRQQNLALQAAEAALQAGLSYLESQTLPPIADSKKVWPSCTVAANNTGSACTYWNTLLLQDWRNAAVTAVKEGASYSAIVTAMGGTGGTLSGVVAEPRIYIEERFVPPLDVDQAAQGTGVHYFTVFAVGFGGSDSARAIVQSTVAKVYQY